MCSISFVPSLKALVTIYAKCGTGLQLDSVSMHAGLGAAHEAERAREAGSAAKAVLAEAEQRLSEAEANSTVALAAVVSSVPSKAAALPAAAGAEGSHGCNVRPLLYVLI